MSTKKRLLIVEDDTNLGQILTEYLELKGYDARLCRDGEEGLKAFSSEIYDICLLDVMMPKMDGFTLAREIKSLNRDTPFIFLTAKSMREDAIKGLTIGADDYITKPFSMEELLLRLKVILRRAGDQGNKERHEFKTGSLKFDPHQRNLIIAGKLKKLTSRENELLKLLFMHENSVLSRKMALQSIWGDDSYFNSRSMDVYITKLRKYLKPEHSLQILTLHGEGFKLVNLQ